MKSHYFYLVDKHDCNTYRSQVTPFLGGGGVSQWCSGRKLPRRPRVDSRTPLQPDLGSTHPTQSKRFWLNPYQLKTEPLWEDFDTLSNSFQFNFFILLDTRINLTELVACWGVSLSLVSLCRRPAASICVLKPI